MTRIPIVVIGASAGGVEAVSQIVRRLPADFPAAVFVAMHFPVTSTSVLPTILTRVGHLPASHPRDGDPIQAGVIFVAPPDRHLLIMRDSIRLTRGAHENGLRPSVDPMFRSAAIAHGPRVIGVVLTGNLDDGTVGLKAIKLRGGQTIVQDPGDALFPGMPTSAMHFVKVDRVAPLAQIPDALIHAVQLAQSRAAVAHFPDDALDETVRRETAFAELDLGTIEDVENHPGQPSQFACPDCGGVLWEMKEGDITRFRCRVGHAWTGEGLMGRQDEHLDATLWSALRALEERLSLLKLMAARARRHGYSATAVRHERAAQIAATRAAMIRDTLAAAPNDMSNVASAQGEANSA